MLWLCMPNPEAVRLRHMREAAAAAIQMAGGHRRADVSSNLMLAMALTRCLEILGEAASKVSPEICSHFHNIPFSKMISMRNRLIHAYFDVDLDIVWTTIEDDLPSLLSALDKALAEIDS
jgi:uncharacterized protein with HEPN domain